jgi:hypothetical protein
LAAQGALLKQEGFAGGVDPKFSPT